MAHVDPPVRRRSLALQETDRPADAGGGSYEYERRARYTPRLRESQPQLDFLIDRTPLQQLLRDHPVPEPETYGLPDPSGLMSIIDMAWPAEAAADLRRLAGDLPRDDTLWPLAPGRLPLYVCPVDHDLGCGAITVAVTHNHDETAWSDFRLEGGIPDEEIGLDLSAFGPLVFPRTSYRAALLEPVGVLDALDTDEQAAKLEHRRHRTPAASGEDSVPADPAHDTDTPAPAGDC